ncbi:MAG: glycosyltransferase, partial [bacterium]
MNQLTAQILVKNNESVIESCLNSISDLNCQILIGDFGCSDGTIKICKEYGAEIHPLSLNNSLSKARNILIEKSKNKWNIFLEPHEILFQGKELIPNILERKKIAYNCKIMQGDAIYRQIKLWDKDLNLKFENPVFEEIKSEKFEESEIIFISGEKDNSLSFELCKKWMEDQPLNNKAIYYFACCNLFQKNWNSFLNYADLYLHNEKDKTSTSCVMTKYYYAMVKSYITKDFNEAVQKLIECIAEKPLMAEFWCLLGDIY